MTGYANLTREQLRAATYEQFKEAAATVVEDYVERAISLGKKLEVDVESVEGRAVVLELAKMLQVEFHWLHDRLVDAVG